MNIVHRDIKGENILLGGEMTVEETDVVVKISDFGLACYMDPSSKGLKKFCGSDLFMAPEILKNWDNPSSLPNIYKSKLQNYDCKVDIWALGVMTYEMLSGGHLPFESGDTGQRHADVLTRRPPYSQYPVFQDRGIRDFVKMCLLVDPSKRPSAKALLTHSWLKNHK